MQPEIRDGGPCSSRVLTRSSTSSATSGSTRSASGPERPVLPEDDLPPLDFSVLEAVPFRSGSSGRRSSVRRRRRRSGPGGAGTPRAARLRHRVRRHLAQTSPTPSAPDGNRIKTHELERSCRCRLSGPRRGPRLPSGGRFVDGAGVTDEVQVGGMRGPGARGYAELLHAYSRHLGAGVADRCTPAAPTSATSATC